MISRKVKGKIIYSLSMFVMLFVVLSGVSLQWLKESENFRLADETVEQIKVNTLDMLRTDNDFYMFNLNDSVFFAEGITPLLHKHDSLYNNTQKLIASVREVKNFKLDSDLFAVDTSLVGYDRRFTVLVSKLRKKGFKDYGLEGKFRSFAHALEDKKLIATNEILMLRRHEKDYLLRDDPHYVEQLNQLSVQLKGKYITSLEARALIDDYTTSFNELVRVNEEIGFHTQENLKGELNTHTALLLKALEDLNAKGELQTAQNYGKTFKMFIVAMAFAIVFCGVLIFLTARAV